MALSGATFDLGGRVLKQTRQSVPASPHSAAGVTSQAASPEAERGGSGQMLLRDTTTHLVPFSLSSHLVVPFSLSSYLGRITLHLET